MQKNQFNILITKIEEFASTVKYDFEIADAFNNLLDQHKADLTPDQEQRLKSEFLLFRLVTKNHFASDGLRTDRFVPMATFNNGAIFPDPNTFPDDALSYFEIRAKESKNSILKARYLDFLWEKSKSKQKHLFAIEAVEQYIQTVDAYDNEEVIFEKLDGLQRATELCLILEGKSAKKPLTQKVVTKLNEQIDDTDKNKKYRWFIELFEIVIALSEFYKNEDLKRFIALCNEGAEYYHNDQNFHLQRAFLELKAKLAKLPKSAQTIKQEVDDAIGQSLIDEAEAKSGSGLVKAHFLQEAVDHYSKLGNKKKVSELISQIKEATGQAIKNNEFKQFSSTVELKKEDEERMKKNLGVGEKVPENMGTPPNFFPNWYHAIKLTEELNKKYVVSQLFPTVHYGDKYPIGRPQTQEEVREDQVMQNFKIEADLAVHWLTRYLSELIEEKKVTVDDFKKFFAFLKNIDNDTYETVLIGLDSYFNDDHFRAACILTLQLEDFLRQLLSVFGGQTTVPEAGAFREKTLGSILMELKPFISDPMYYYISWVMEDYRGFNLRNNIAHGFFKKKHGSPKYSTAVLHIFCLLIANTKISTKQEGVK